MASPSGLRPDPRACTDLLLASLETNPRVLIPLFRKKKPQLMLTLVSERVGFEPTKRFLVYTLSKRAP